MYLEQWTPARKRRADVAVELTDGARLALEAQQAYVSDEKWCARHRDYVAAGITDVWFWRRNADIPRRILAEGVPAWLIHTGASVAATTIETFIGRPHPKGWRWWNEPDPSMYTLHHPPCPADDMVAHFPRPSVTGRDAPATPISAACRAGEGLPRPTAAVHAFRRGVLDGCFQDLHRVHGLTPRFREARHSLVPPSRRAEQRRRRLRFMLRIAPSLPLQGF
ncbi:competence protein CoiA family protein [Nonomuraea deserti]|uniref:competence protein CoiA family protein n=1 Tax=Nonomuraea deserti TaxID=1848322 RepID=UPI003F6DE749